MHGQIILGLYRTLINLSPTVNRERKERRERRNIERGTQAILTTPIQRCQEGYEQPMEEPWTIGILKPSRFNLESFHLTICQVGIVPRPQQLQLGEMQQDSGQR
jgi:hypothetical protein